MEIIDRFVEFSKYCDTCKHAEKDSSEDPCEECLTNATNVYTDRPVKWEPRG